jgi:hypothetical protein
MSVRTLVQMYVYICHITCSDIRENLNIKTDICDNRKYQMFKAPCLKYESLTVVLIPRASPLALLNSNVSMTKCLGLQLQKKKGKSTADVKATSQSIEN